MAAAAPSTVANPLEDSLAKIMGTNTTAPATTASSLVGYDPNASFRQPEADVISIYGDPGTGATTAETWAQQNELARQAQEQLEFEYQQSQDVLAQELAQAEEARQAEELGISQSAEARAAEQFGLTEQTTAQQLASGAQAMTSEAQRQAQTEQAMGYATTAEARAAEQAALDAAAKKQAYDIAASEQQRKDLETYGIFGDYEGYKAAAQAIGAEQAATHGAPVGTKESVAYRYATYPNYYPSEGEMTAAQQMGYGTYTPAAGSSAAKWVPSSAYQTPSNTTYTKTPGGGTAKAGRWDAAQGRWVY